MIATTLLISIALFVVVGTLIWFVLSKTMKRQGRSGLFFVGAVIMALLGVASILLKSHMTYYPFFIVAVLWFAVGMRQRKQS